MVFIVLAQDLSSKNNDYGGQFKEHGLSGKILNDFRRLEK